MTIETLAERIVDAVRAGRWSSPRSGTLLRHARLVLRARAFGSRDDALLDTLAVAARTEIAASTRPTPEMEAMLPTLRAWQSSPRSSAVRVFETHGPYASADQAIAVAEALTAAATPAARAA